MLNCSQIIPVTEAPSVLNLGTTIVLVCLKMKEVGPITAWYFYVKLKMDGDVLILSVNLLKGMFSCFVIVHNHSEAIK